MRGRAVWLFVWDMGTINYVNLFMWYINTFMMLTSFSGQEWKLQANLSIFSQGAAHCTSKHTKLYLCTYLFIYSFVCMFEVGKKREVKTFDCTMSHVPRSQLLTSFRLRCFDVNEPDQILLRTPETLPQLVCRLRSQIPNSHSAVPSNANSWKSPKLSPFFGIRLW